MYTPTLARIIVRMAAALLGATLVTSASAAQDAPDPAQWGARSLDLASSRQAGVAFIPVRILFAMSESAGDDPGGLLGVDEATFAGKTFLRPVSPADLRLTIRVNAARPQAAAMTPFGRLAAFSRADVFAFASARAFNLLTRSESMVPVPLATFTPPSADGAQMGAAISKALGYHGVILAQRGDLVVALTPRLVRTTSLQMATAIAESSAVRTVPLDHRKVVALLELVATRDGFSVYRIGLSAGVATPQLPPGTKVVIEGM